MRIPLASLVPAAAAMVSGCASVTGGNVQSMIVVAAEKGGKDVAGAECVLSNNKGSWRVKTPGEATIVRSNAAMTVKCEKEALPAGMATVESATRSAMFGNILIGGVVGAAIDHSSGAAYEYPVTVKVIMGDMIAIAAPKAPEGTHARGGPRVHDKQFDLPTATGFANAADVNAVPAPAARTAYSEFLQKPAPKAFVLASDGTPFWSSNTSAAVQRAMDRCGERHTGCRLYAYDDVVVWKATYALDAPRPRRETRPPRTQAEVAVAPPAPVTPATPVTPVRTPSAASSGDDGKALVRTTVVASGYANVADVAKLAELRPQARAAYEEFLARPLPRAFALAEGRGWWASWGTRPKNPDAHPDPAVRIIPDCEQYHQRRCTIYAIDDVVVYQPETNQAAQP